MMSQLTCRDQGLEQAVPTRDPLGRHLQMAALDLLEVSSPKQTRVPPPLEPANHQTKRPRERDPAAHAHAPRRKFEFPLDSSTRDPLRRETTLRRLSCGAAW